MSIKSTFIIKNYFIYIKRIKIKHILQKSNKLYLGKGEQCLMLSYIDLYFLKLNLINKIYLIFNYGYYI